MRAPRRTGPDHRLWTHTTALVAVAVLLVHALVLGWHVPPPLRALAADGWLCLAPTQTASADVPGGSAPDAPSLGDHLKRCPLCLSADAVALGPADGPVLPAPAWATTDRARIVAAAPRADRPQRPFHARAPPATA